METSLHPAPMRRPFSCREAIAGVVNDPPEIDLLLAAGRRYAGYKYWKDIRTGEKYCSLPGVTLGFNARKLDPTKPSATIRENDGRLHTFGAMHWTEQRKFTMSEYARFMSFPDEFLWPEKDQLRDRWECAVSQMGNSVPPLFMKAVASNIRHFAFGGPEPSMPEEAATYPEILNAAWAAHLKPKAADAPMLISAFAGCGGSSLGYSMAGFRELLAVEWDKHAVETFSLNFPDVDVFAEDIANLPVDEVLKRTGLEPGELDLLDGSPPCQGFSTAGKRSMSDERNKLFLEFGRLLGGLQPRVFVMENVSGMVKGKMKVVFVEILRYLKSYGYNVEVRLMSTMYFHVPQHRQRLIFIGVRKDLGVDPSHPRPERRPVTVGEAFSKVPEGIAAPVPRGADEVFPHIPPGGTAYKSVPCDLLARYAPRMVNNKTFQFGSMCRRLAEHRPAETLTKTFIAYSEPLIHPREDRYLSSCELARLSSFPDQFEWPDHYRQIVAMTGNCVPPMFMKAIADHIRGKVLPG